MISKTRINQEAQRKNSELKSVIFEFKKKKEPELVKVARYLALPRRKAISVNLDKINKYSKEKEIILVPGKVLSQGDINKKIELVSFKISDHALKKLKSSGSTYKPLKQFIKEKEIKKFKIII